MTLAEYKAKHRLTQAKLAEVLGISVRATTAYLDGYRKPEPERIPAIVAATNGEVTAADLRPDLAAIFAPTPAGGKPGRTKEAR